MPQKEQYLESLHIYPGEWLKRDGQDFGGPPLRAKARLLPVKPQDQAQLAP